MKYLEKARAAHDVTIQKYKKLSEKYQGESMKEKLQKAQEDMQAELLAAGKLAEKAYLASQAGITDEDLAALAPVAASKPTKGLQPKGK